MKVRTRFAPSPTGALHAGTVRTALFAWLTARHDDGDFILRIEDTDQSREVQGAVDNIIESLTYLGLDWDEGPDKGGPYEPYTQSQRLDLYKQWAQKLIDSGRAYADPYTKEELAAFRQQAQDQKKPFLYRNHRPDSPPAWNGSQPLRFKSEPKAYHWHDEVMGDLNTGAEVIDDFVIIKSDGYPTYNFAHIVDDHTMQISHVVRSQEFISSMPNFLNLYDALGFEWPIFVTVPNVLSTEGTRKLSKREGAKQLLDYQKMGILPEALMNCLATTGWNDGTEQEIFSKDELIKKFSLDHIQKSGARFDEQRLEWMDGQYIRDLSKDELAKAASSFWPKESATTDESYKQAVLALVQERLKYFAELPELTELFFNEPEPSRVVELFKAGKTPLSELPSLLEAASQTLQQSNFSKDDIAGKLNELLDKLGIKPGILFSAIRIAISGTPHSPELFGTLEVLGKTKSLDRLSLALESIKTLL